MLLPNHLVCKQDCPQSENSILLVWSKNSSSLPVSEKLIFFNADELIEGTGFITATPDKPHDDF
jgi:hypothetical protein